MKKTLIIFAAGIAMLAACNKETPKVRPSSIPEDAAEIHITLGYDADTKATFDPSLQANEQKVNSVQILVFNDGAIDAYGNDYKKLPDDSNFRGEYGVRLTATRGERRIYAAVNASADLSAVATEAELLEKISYLKDNAIGAFEMIGCVDKTLLAKNYIDIPVDRFAVRIKIDKITNSFTNSYLGDRVYLRRMYMTNVAGDSKYDFSPQSMQYATSGFGSSLDLGGTTLGATDQGKLNPLLYQTIYAGSANLSSPGAAENCPKINHNSSYSTSHSFYVYPNGDLETLPTHLVIEVVVNEKIYTYPLKLSTDSITSLEYNKSYEIAELILTRVGNISDGDDDIDPGEDTPIEPADADFKVTVKDWTVKLLGDGGVVRI